MTSTRQTVPQTHICGTCGHVEPLDLYAYVAGARVVAGTVVWFCERHRDLAPDVVRWPDCPAAPYTGD